MDGGVVAVRPRGIEMTTVPRTSRVKEHPRAAKVPRPRKPVDQRSVTAAPDVPRSRPGWPDQVPDDRPPAVPVLLRRRTIPEQRLTRTGAAAALGMLLVAGLLGAVGGVILLWVGTGMLQYLR